MTGSRARRISGDVSDVEGAADAPRYPEQEIGLMALLVHRRFINVARRLTLGLIAGWSLTSLLTPVMVVPPA